MSVDLSSVTDTFLTDFEEQGADDFETIDAHTLYGREKETALLLQTYERVLQSRQSQIVLVHGLSGQGKTALINNFRATVCSAGGLFCGAKYFQNSGFQEPHSAIIAAFSDLCDLVVQSSTLTKVRRQQIRNDLGPKGGILQKILSNVSPLLEGYSCDFDGEMNSEALTTLFRVALRTFLRAMASSHEPVVVFLDDIQWMDEGSRKLIEMYASDTDLKNVMFILAYRDEDIDCVERLLTNVNLDALVDVPVGKLSKEGVADMVHRRMQCPLMNSSDKGKDTNDLVDLICHRTNGNPFHVIQFIDTIQLEGLLTFDWDSKTWIFDVQDIKRKVMIATSVADLLLRKIQLLPKSEQETLKLASLLGYDFDESVLFQIVREERRSHDSDESVATSTRSLSLRKAHEMGLVERVGDVCHFPHDKIQSAFLSMIGDEEEMQLQRTIGETYLLLENDDNVYLAALHLNQTLELMKSTEERVRLVRINLEASKFIADRSAFDAAAGLLRQSLSILDCDRERDKWSEHFELTFEIMEKLATMELIVGNLERCRDLTEETLSRATTLEMKINSLLNAVECQPTAEDLIQTGMRVLKALGVHCPRKVRGYHVMRKIFAVRRLLRGKTDEDILQLPPMEDEAQKAASRILMNICQNATLIDENVIAIYAALAAFELTLRHGLCPHGPTYLILFGTAELFLKNCEQAKRFAALGKKLLDQMQSKTTECSAYLLWIGMFAHWTEPLDDLQEWIIKGVESGLQIGDVVHTPNAISALFGLTFELGGNLQDVAGLMQQYYNRLRDLSQDETILLAVQPSFQAVINLQSETNEWIDLTALTGEIMNEESFFRKTANLKNTFFETIALSYKAMLAYNFGFIDLAVQAYGQMANVVPQFYNSSAARSWFLWGSLTFYEHYRRTGAGRHFRKARKWQRRMEKVHASGSPNVPYVSLLHAEEQSFQTRVNVDVLVSAYDTAIATMADEKRVHLEGLANERAGFFLVEKNMKPEARPYFDRALRLYKHGWGACAKYDWLQERVSVLLAPRESQSTIPHPSSPQIVVEIPMIKLN